MVMAEAMAEVTEVVVTVAIAETTKISMVNFIQFLFMQMALNFLICVDEFTKRDGYPGSYRSYADRSFNPHYGLDVGSIPCKRNVDCTYSRYRMVERESG